MIYRRTRTPQTNARGDSLAFDVEPKKAVIKRCGAGGWHISLAALSRAQRRQSEVQVKERRNCTVWCKRNGPCSKNSCQPT